MKCHASATEAAADTSEAEEGDSSPAENYPKKALKKTCFKRNTGIWRANQRVRCTLYMPKKKIYKAQKQRHAPRETQLFTPKKDGKLRMAAARRYNTRATH